MVFYSKSLMIVIVMIISISMALSKALGQQDKDVYPSQLDVSGDDGSMERSLLSYLYARQMANRMRSSMDSSDFGGRKRSYWKQCAFNAVSCFGKK